jgi:hypothetical protein
MLKAASVQFLGHRLFGLSQAIKGQGAAAISGHSKLLPAIHARSEDGPETAQ